jgi:FdhD protein
MAEQLKTFARTVIEQAGRRDEPGELPLEAPLHLEVNGVHLATLMRLPGNDRELALGFWRTDGLIAGREDIAVLEHCPDDPNLLRIRLTGDLPERRPMAIGTACGGILGRDLPEPVPLAGPPVSAEVLMGLRPLLEQNQPVRERAGGVHAAALFTREGDLVCAYEDVGRHNALDKVIGHCLLHGLPVADKIVVMTGRHTAEMVLKLARAGVGLACSIAAPSALGAELADQLGVTLVARLRRNQLQVFTHPDRVA